VQRATWRVGSNVHGKHRATNPGRVRSTNEQRQISMHRARRARYVDTCFARGAEGGPWTCGANCLDLKGKMVMSSAGCSRA
jgi:hypothetical protein